MKPWFDDILDQLAVAHILAHAGISCGERLAMIIVDNAVEYTCKAYVEVFKNLVPKIIKKADWEAKKRSFADLIRFVAQNEPALDPRVNQIIGFHEIRNNLYHEGQPVSVKPATVDSYAKEARDIIEVLLRTREAEAEQSSRIASIHKGLLGEAGRDVKIGVNFEPVNNAIRLKGVKANVSEAVCLIAYGFPVHKGVPPTIEQLDQSLAHSGHTSTRKILSTRIAELRRKGLLRKLDLGLTDKGRKEILRRFSVSL